MSNWKLSRRHFIASSGATLLLPLLGSLMPRQARAATPDPKRFVCLYMPDGTYNVPNDEPWSQPNGALSASTVGDVLSPFGANLGDLTMIKHIKFSMADAAFVHFPNYPVSLHQTTPLAYLTGRSLSGSTLQTTYVDGSSIDQQFADFTGKPAFTLAAENNPFVLFPNNGGSSFMTISYKNQKQIAPTLYPGDLYNSVFAGLVPMPSKPASPAVRNASILDTATADLKDLQTKLGKNDNARLDDYLTSLRALEQKLQASTMPPSQCQPLPAPDASLNAKDTYGQLQNFTQKMNAFMDMMVLAFKCDLTRSIVLMYGGEESVRVLGTQIPTSLHHPQLTSDQLSILESIQDHPFAHYETAMLDKPAMITRDRYRMWLATYFINALKSATDPSGSPILDNTVVLGGYGIPDGMHGNSAHGPCNAAPIFVAGGKNLGLVPGRSVEAGSYDMGDLLFTMSAKLGMGLTDFAGFNKTVPI